MNMRSVDAPKVVQSSDLSAVYAFCKKTAAAFCAYSEMDVGKGQRACLFACGHLEKSFLDSCTSMPIDWRAPKNWARNTSADFYSATWDETEQAMRFDVAWNDTQTDRCLRRLA